MFNNAHTILEIHVQKFSQRNVTKKSLSKSQRHDNAKIDSVRALSFGVEDISILIKYIWVTKTSKKKNEYMIQTAICIKPFA